MSAPTISDFILLKPISAGAFGKVFLGYKKVDETKKYAIKIVSKEVMRMKNLNNQLTAEKNALALSKSDYIVHLYYSLQTDNYVYLVMEYLIGGDLKSFIHFMGYLDEGPASFYCAEITLALAYLHRHSIIHRDLKPDNVIIASTGHIKLTDFGLSTVQLSRSLSLDDVLNTPSVTKIPKDFYRTPGQVLSLMTDISFKSSPAKNLTPTLESTVTRSSDSSCISLDATATSIHFNTPHCSDSSSSRLNPPDKDHSDKSVTPEEKKKIYNELEEHASISLEDDITYTHMPCTPKIKRHRELALSDVIHRRSELPLEDIFKVPAEKEAVKAMIKTIHPRAMDQLRQTKRKSFPSTSRKRSLSQMTRSKSLECNAIPIFELSRQNSVSGSRLNEITKENTEPFVRFFIPNQREKTNEEVASSAQSIWTEMVVNKKTGTSSVINKLSILGLGETPTGMGPMASPSLKGGDTSDDDDIKCARNKKQKTEHDDTHYPTGGMPDARNFPTCLADMDPEKPCIAITPKRPPPPIGTPRSLRHPPPTPETPDQSTRLLGTPDYLAPELLQPDSFVAGYEKAVDWWALGVVLYEMLMGATPFMGETPQEVFKNIIQRKINWSTDDDETSLSPSAMELICGLLESDPRKRFTDSCVRGAAFMAQVPWDRMQEAQMPFIPNPDNDMDTFYFEVRNQMINWQATYSGVDFSKPNN